MGVLKEGVFEGLVKTSGLGPPPLCGYSVKVNEIHGGRSSSLCTTLTLALKEIDF